MESAISSPPFGGSGGGIKRIPAVSSAVIGTLILTVTEVMFFCALISAFVVIRSQAVGNWTPPGDIRLPMAATAFNTALLMASGVAMLLSARAIGRKPESNAAKHLMLAATVLGALFVTFQGYEWVKLARYGLTMSSSIFGATFFLLIGSHGVHAGVAVLVMAVLYRRLAAGRLSASGLRAMTVFWTFVVAIWPILYRLVYWS